MFPLEAMCCDLSCWLCIMVSFDLMKMVDGFIRVRNRWALSFLHVVVCKLPLI